jgi:phosphoribosylaminoimidazole-succinocarboxamide synthase
VNSKYKKLEQLYEGKAKKIFKSDVGGVYIVEYKDAATAGNGAKKGVIAGKGIVNNLVTNRLMQLLEKRGIPTHFIEELSDTETAVRQLTIVPLEVIVRNIAAGSLAARLGLAEGTKLSSTVLEYCYKDDSLGDPMVNEYHIAAMDWASKAELKTISGYAFEINEILSAHLQSVGIELIDFKLEFGRTDDGKIILADEISPDTCRFWDTKTGKKLDKDRFRRDLGGVEDAYREVMNRLLI